MDRTVKLFEDETEIYNRYTGAQFTYIRGKIHGEMKQFGNGKVTKFTVSVSNGKDKDSGEWRPSTFYDCTAFGDKGRSIKESYSDKDMIELILKFSPNKSGERWFYGFNVMDVLHMKQPESDNPYPNGNEPASKYSNGDSGDFEEIPENDDLPF